MHISQKLLPVLLLTTAFSAMAAAPVTPTDAGRVLQDNQAPGSPNTPLPPPIQAPQAPKQTVPEGATQDIRIKVNEFTFSGNSVISTEKLQATIAEFTNRELNFGELLQVTDKIETLYREAGYFLAQATLPPQKIRSGIIDIVVTEGRLGKVRLEGESRIKPDVLYRYLDKLPTGEVMIEDKLDRQALLASELAGTQIKLDLQAGDTPGTTDVVLVQQATPMFTGRASLDNHGLPATGENRLSVNAALNSPFHLGDRFSTNFIISDSRDLHTYGLRYELPIGGDGWRVNLAKTRAVYSLGGAFTALDANGTADSWRGGVSYPWLRSSPATSAPPPRWCSPWPGCARGRVRWASRR